MSQVDPRIPVQTVTFIYGSNVAFMGKQQLINAATAIKIDIERLETANDGVDSVAIAAEIATLKEAMVKVREVLDAEHSSAPAPTAE